MTEGLKGIITQLERQKTAIEHALAALREIEGIEDTAPAASPAITPATRKSGTKSNRNRRSEGQRKRWAAKKAAERATAAGPVKPAPRKVRLTAEGRKRLAEAMKRRWAVKRAASAVTRTARKKLAGEQAS